jgi:hypothetical protein
VVGTESKRKGEKSCMWVVVMQQRIRRAKTVAGSWERKERLRVDGCPEGRVSALRRAVYPDLHGPGENPS